MRKLQLLIKRIIDTVAAACGLLVLSPLMVLIALAIRLTSRGPALFRQERLGRDSATFRIFKFRTMVRGAAKMGTGMSTLADDPRLTPVGRLLRKTSLDEIPQLFNVLLGDMSLVGPRPTVPAQLEYYDDVQRRRLDMPPGITGWAMVHGRSSNPWSVRIRYDVEYVENFSLWLDFKIILRTLWLVVKRESTAYDYDKHGPAFDLTKPGESAEERARRLDV